MKILKGLASCIAGIFLICFGSAYAMNGDENIIRVMVNGQYIEFTDQQPVEINGRTLLPIRPVMEAMGKNVEWNDSTQNTVIYDNDIRVSLKIGDMIIHKYMHDAANNEELSFTEEMDTAPILINDRTCLPVRFVAEAFMASVDWEEETQTVMIVTADLLC